MLQHFAIDPRISPNYMAQVDASGIHVHPNTYFLTGEEFVIPAQGGMVVAFLCHVPAHEHDVEPGGCALLKHMYDAWHISTCVMLTNNDPYIALLVPKFCDIYALLGNCTIELAVADDADFYHFFNLKK
jgi:hypothetical protein